MIVGDYTGAFLALLFATLGTIVAGYAAAPVVHLRSRRSEPARRGERQARDELKAA